MQIAGMIPFSTVDYPGLLSAVLFSQGCPWRCGYCHNPHLQPFRRGTLLWEDVMAFLAERKGKLEAVVFSGGEPALQKGLSEAMREVRKLGYKIGLHTAGIHPKPLAQVLPEIDWVGMDIKAPFEKYSQVTRIEKSGVQAEESARLIIASQKEAEFRTTVHPNLLTPDDIEEIAETLQKMGAKRFALQRFRPDGCRDEGLNSAHHEIVWSEPFLQKIAARFATFLLR